jgi:GNAT superfamily N-acetyltransferase
MGRACAVRPGRAGGAPGTGVIVNSIMAVASEALGKIHLEELAPESPDTTLAHARELLLEYGRFVIAQPGAARFCFGALEKEAARLPLSFIEQGGGCLMAWAHGEPAGFVAWRAVPRQVAPDSWELKRLWVCPSARGLGLGRTLTQAVLDRAISAHRKSIYLDTAPASMGSAHRLYLEMGFIPCPPYNDNPVEGLAYLVKVL